MEKGVDTNPSGTVEDWAANWGHIMACKEGCKRIDVFVARQMQGEHMRGDEHREMDMDMAVEIQVAELSWVLERTNLNAATLAVANCSGAASN